MTRGIPGEVFVTIGGVRKYLWRAVDQHGNVLDILIQSRRDGKAATRFFTIDERADRPDFLKAMTAPTPCGQNGFVGRV
ncbi:DDE-type integrase/transposase/recombinase [Rhodococcus erythropolis]|uniref:DDE-type integrase/transposase/recombinase n=1 Tax=Rhodococcus erythropolis TaxID=1833 RepID=UPI00294A6821|nr:DDE-type integrase/transposase/recombinase [Rhodococcus erythropolis]MDV6278536.1 DDE-type integrase/transposase/recombinase [Rhodococcus erythropolis]